MHCSNVAADALKAAIIDYKKRRGLDYSDIILDDDECGGCEGACTGHHH
jgi:hypothetical protein